MPGNTPTVQHDAIPGGLVRKLVSKGLLDNAQAAQISLAAAKSGITVLRQLVKSGTLDSRTVASFASREYHLPFFNLAALGIRNLPLSLVDARLIRKHNVLPLMQRGNRLCLAVSDQTNESAINEVRFNASAAVELVVVEDDQLQAAIETFLSKAGRLPTVPCSTRATDSADSSTGSPAEESLLAADEYRGADDAPVVRFVNKILMDAIRSGASDIHIEPYEKFCRIRFRLDGILKETARPPQAIATRICARLKVMAHMDISEKRLPQDGRIRLRLSPAEAVDFRINTLPVQSGEKLVLRVLGTSSAQPGIEALGLEHCQKQLYLDALGRQQGLILVTGPTGSGKTVTLYTGLNLLNTQERNISTAEDPVEMKIEGINQVSVNTRVGLTFASALRAFLRQDPDVVIVGEFRDPETAGTAIKAAQTGHLVLSTLHTKCAPETLARLKHLGIADYSLATSVSLIIAQRLARQLCIHCRKPLKLPRQTLLNEGFREKQLAGLVLFGPTGCSRCLQGYRGRVGFHEVLPVNERIARAIMENAGALEIASIARELGYPDLRTSALGKVAAGLTSLAEANRLTCR
jgi:type IV pilus assembly protein PilB